MPGHWEGDLIAGSHNTYIATLVERHTRYVMLMKVSDRKTETVINALIKHSKRLPDELCNQCLVLNGAFQRLSMLRCALIISVVCGYILLLYMTGYIQWAYSNK